MDVHEFVAAAQAAGILTTVEREVSPHLEIARLAGATDGRPVLFTRVAGSAHPVLANVCADRHYFGMGLGVPPDRIVHRLADALAAPRPVTLVADGPCRAVVEPSVDLEAIPFLTHYPGDAGPYATAAVAFIVDPESGPNASYHRLLRLDRRRMAARLVEGRGAETAWRRSADGIPVALCIGLPLHVLLAAAMTAPRGVDEMTIAEALAPTPMVACANGIRVPADAELVLEGWITRELADEGPFLDLTGTYDLVRRQPIIEIERVTHRRDAIYQALLPAGPEHRLLMGMPREPTIFAEVSRVARCLNVNLTPGGASWLHAVIQIAKRSPDDGRNAIAAALRGHGSLKHVWVVDEDVDPFDPNDVEWAVATRVQADRDLVVLADQPSSSLDPSAAHVPGRATRTAKMGIDATVHWDGPDGPSNPAAFARVR